MIIDDDQIYVYLMKKIIMRNKIGSNAEIIELNDGQQAFDYLFSNFNVPDMLPDMIILDIKMPNMDGLKFLDEFSKLKPQILKEMKIFICSSSFTNLELERMKKYGLVSDFYAKPFTDVTFEKIYSHL